MERRIFTEPVSKSSFTYAINPPAPRKSTQEAKAQVQIKALQKDQTYIQTHNKTRIISVIAVLAGLIVVAASYLNSYLNTRQLHNLLPADITSQASFPIYVPDDTSYKINKNAATISQDILTYQVKTPQNSYVVTEQSNPDNFELAQFASSNDISNTSQLTSPYGPALTGTVNNRSIAIISAPKTIITVVSEGSSNTQDLLPILKSFKIVN